MPELVPLTGEPLPIDLVNTRPAIADLIATPDALRAWLRLQDAPEADEPFEEDDLDAVLRVREATATALREARQGQEPPPHALDVLNRAQRDAPAIRELTWDGTAVRATAMRAGPPGTRLAARLAEAAADLLADPGVTRIRECEADDCVMLFLPAHPRRRWCSAARCGNRARVARYYQRHR